MGMNMSERHGLASRHFTSLHFTSLNGLASRPPTVFLLTVPWRRATQYTCTSNNCEKIGGRVVATASRLLCRRPAVLNEDAVASTQSLATGPRCTRL